MRLTSYAPTLFLDIKSCPGQAPASDLAHQQSQEESGVAHARLVQGLSVAEVVEAGEVPGSKKMTTLSCSLGSNDS